LLYAALSNNYALKT